MVPRWLRRNQPSLNPNLTLDDVLRHLPDRAQASAAFAELLRLDRLELIDVYLPAGWIAAGHRKFNVWISRHLLPDERTAGRRVTLAEWCAQWLADGGAAENGGVA